MRPTPLCPGAAALLCAAALQAQSVSDLVINELMADNTATVANELGAFEDWFEILNPTSATLTISGLHLTDDPSTLTKWQIPPTGLTISPGEHLLIWADNPLDPNDPLLTDLHASFRLGRSGEQLLLVGADGVTVIDEVTFPAIDADISYGRFPDGASSLIRMDLPTPRTANQGASGTAQARLNEILADNAGSLLDERGEAEPWVELHNTSGIDLDLSGMHLTDEASDPTRWGFPQGTSLQPGDWLVVWLDGETSDGSLHTGFSLPATGGTVTLFSTDGASQLDQISIGPLGAGVARAHFVDGADDLFETDRPTPGRANEIFDSAHGAVIGEILASNATGAIDEMGETADWIELENRSASAINVAGLFLTDSLSNPGKWQIPGVAEASMPPGGRLSIWADGDLTDGPLHAAFSLGANGEAVGLFQQTGPGTFAPIDTVVFGSQTADASLIFEGEAPRGRVPTSTPTHSAPNALGLTVAQVAQIVIDAFALPTDPQLAETDANLDGQRDVADVVVRVNLD